MSSSSCLVPTSWHPTGVPDCPEGPFGGSGRPVTHLLLHFAFPQGRFRKVAQQRIWGDNPVPTKCIWSYSSVRTIAAGTQGVPGVSSTCQIPTFYLWDTDVRLYMWNMKGRSWGLFPELSVFNITCLPLGAAGLLPASAGWLSGVTPGCGTVAPSCCCVTPVQPQLWPVTRLTRRAGICALAFCVFCTLLKYHLSWILSQTLWISHKIRFSQHSDRCQNPWHAFEAKNNRLLCAELTSAVSPGYRGAFRQPKNTTLRFPCDTSGFCAT